MKLIIVAIIIFGPLVILGLIKLFKKTKKTPMSSTSPTSSKPKKSWFWISIQIVVLLWIAFGIYLFTKWYFFPSKQIEKNAQNQTYSTPAKPKEEVWDWTFEWEATAEQLASGRQKTVGLINDAQIISCNANVLKFRYKRPSGKIVNLTLDRDSPEKEYYFGRVAQSDLYLRVWLLSDEKGNFHGQSDNGPGKMAMDVFLKKKL